MRVLVAVFVLALLVLGLFVVKGLLLMLVGLLVVLAAPFVLFATIATAILGDFFKLMGGGSGHRRHGHRRHRWRR